MKKVPSRFWRWFVEIPCLVYLVGLIGFCGMHIGGYADSPFMKLLDVFLPFLFMPLLLVLPFVILVRSRIMAASWVGALALFGYFYGAFFVPRQPVGAAEGNVQLRVMTFNLGPGQAVPGQLVAAIKREDADLVAVQELTAPVAEVLQNELKEQYPYTILVPKRETTGLLSRYPVLEAQWLQGDDGGRAFLQASIDWDGQPLYFFAVHPFPTRISWYRDTRIPIGVSEAEPQKTVLGVVKQLKTVEGIKIIAGDFNMSDQTATYATLSAATIDAYREAGFGFGFTFPNNLRLGQAPIPGPFVRLDYIFHSPELSAQQAYVGCSGSSDHCYLVARFVPVR